MARVCAVQMDAIESVDIDADSTFALALEAQARGYRLFHYLPDALSFRDGRVVARGRAMRLARTPGDHYDLDTPQTLDLARDADVVLMRQDPPFDMAYITYTHFLEQVRGRTLVVNDPEAVRNAPEKLYVTHFQDLMPPTLITRSIDEVRSFRAEHGDIIVKPLFGNGGYGVFRLQPEDQNLASLMEMFLGVSREPVMVQQYLAAVRGGDKRIILVDGEPVGAINRVPAEGEARSNMHVGGRAERSDLSEREREICDRLGPELARRNLIFVGIDVIGGYLTEINVTSPTGIQEIDRFERTNLAGLVWDAIERRLAG
ncbi:glutathione synthase [Rhodothalassium salexigens]|uniref:glutathione synthase n=1 Tax=Rhodothalassium salexigens TaxID=1086 RepID=UPI001913D482|nr:glutathione synthase [Rhodothalassium salexigens]MBK5921403.1 glutathione synthase [Rhodothalassium salexigens]